ncbi:hypothetical protein B0A49_11504 [Cryomyces minteri]|uniref:Uncharacterized protein n=1 Tax=Cryomyces minteri TaxID=331657 RepID=A0A4U0WA55_9PEZI|nr:hypothetical protein B0A49_11504 [Cryomyces minteri]
MASPFPAVITAQPTCTLTILKNPPHQIDCTFYSQTATETAYTDCSGCALTTRQLGVGLPCQTITTLPGYTTTTVTTCLASNRARTVASSAASPPTSDATITDATNTTTVVTTASPTCTLEIFPTFGNLSSATCTQYATYSTETLYTDCAGCALTTVQLGHGPVVRCVTRITEAVGVRTVTSCRPDATTTTT